MIKNLFFFSIFALFVSPTDLFGAHTRIKKDIQCIKANMPQIKESCKEDNVPKIFTAICEGNLEEVKKIILEGEAYKRTSKECTPFACAILYQQTEIANYLLQSSNLDITAIEAFSIDLYHQEYLTTLLKKNLLSSQQKLNLLYSFLRYEIFSSAVKFIENCDQNDKNKIKKDVQESIYEFLAIFSLESLHTLEQIFTIDYTSLKNPLHAAAYNDDERVIAYVHSKAPNAINSKNAYGNTPLHTAITENSNPRAIKTLLSLKPQLLDEPDIYSKTPLELAYNYNTNYNAIAVLVAHGANPSSISSNLHTELSDQVDEEIRKSAQLIELIITHKGNMQTALDECLNADWSDAFVAEECVNIIQYNPDVQLTDSLAKKLTQKAPDLQDKITDLISSKMSISQSSTRTIIPLYALALAGPIIDFVRFSSSAIKNDSLQQESPLEETPKKRKLNHWDSFSQKSSAYFNDLRTHPQNHALLVTPLLAAIIGWMYR